MLSHFSCIQLFVTLWIVAIRFLCPWDSVGKNTRVGCHALLQGTFLNQELSQSLVSPALAGRFFTTWEAFGYTYKTYSLYAVLIAQLCPTLQPLGW